MTALILCAFIVAMAGLSAFSFAMSRHHRQMWQQAPGRGCQILLRCVGAIGLALSFLLCGLIWDWKIGPVVWLGLLTVTGLSLVFALPSLARSDSFWRRLAKNRQSRSSQ
jgi:hypothetical protein